MLRLFIIVSALMLIRIEGSANMQDLSVGPVEDGRFTEIRHLDKTYTFHAPPTRKQWEARKAFLRERLLTGMGLLPMPEKTSLNARIFGRIGHEDYTVEKVYFESYPGFYVTGNLFRPKGKQGPFPAIMNPHGHAKLGRLEDTPRSSTSARCINLAKQGYVAFAYDMVGYNDCMQFKHRAGQLDGPREHLWGLSIGGLQTWNSIRVIDWLSSLPDVDPRRIGCTGGSGGGTQTFFLTAVDDRVGFPAPVNMISSTMQGGCQCENPPLVRIDTNNMEIGAMSAPRPLLLISATGDWTKLTPEVEFPAIRSVYRLLGVEDRVACKLIDAEHNYNLASRETLYPWYGRWILNHRNLKSLVEQPYQAEKDEDLLVWASEPRPGNALKPEEFIEARISDAKGQLEALRPHDLESLRTYRATFGPALRHSLAFELGEVQAEDRGQILAGEVTVRKLILRQGNHAIPALMFEPAKSSDAVLLVHEEGKSASLTNGKPAPLVRGLLAQGKKVLAIDAFNTGELVAGRSADTKSYKYTTTYNRTETAERVQDILTALTYLQGGELIGVGEAGLWCLLARAFAPEVGRTVVDASGFDNSNDQAFVERLFVPGLRRAGDLDTASALTAPGKLLIHNTRAHFNTESIENMYAAAGSSTALRLRGTRASDEEIIAFISAR